MIKSDSQIEFCSLITDSETSYFFAIDVTVSQETTLCKIQETGGIFIISPGLKT
ncbi:MAG: hypothetical protein LBQ24_00470 [Candidatus Peribacteria bacterium]|jgi:hypothetical protein|nr:hypothetical protein [Candidatus Peribacteria bacterium]